MSIGFSVDFPISQLIHIDTQTHKIGIYNFRNLVKTFFGAVEMEAFFWIRISLFIPRKTQLSTGEGSIFVDAICVACDVRPMLGRIKFARIFCLGISPIRDVLSDIQVDKKSLGMINRAKDDTFKSLQQGRIYAKRNMGKTLHVNNKKYIFRYVGCRKPYEIVGLQLANLNCCAPEFWTIKFINSIVDKMLTPPLKSYHPKRKPDHFPSIILQV